MRGAAKPDLQAGNILQSLGIADIDKTSDAYYIYIYIYIYT